VVVRHADEDLLITKGEAESVFAICEAVTIDGVAQPFDDSRRAEAESTLKKLSADGFSRAWGGDAEGGKTKRVHSGGRTCDELVGFAAFLDPPKEGVLAVLKALKQDGISVVVMTGDNSM